MHSAKATANRGGRHRKPQTTAQSNWTPASKPAVIAHRGGRVWAPENTMDAFRLSLEAGVDGIELDVHRCATGELVVIHDDDVNRTTNGVGLVKEISYAQLRRLDAGSWFNPKFSSARIPTLQEVLDLLDGKIMLNIEVKNTPIDYPGIEEDLLSLLQGYPLETIIFSSFDHKIMKRFSQIDSTLQLALLADCLFVDVNQYAADLGCQYWHPCFSSLRQDGVEEAHRGGLKINSWTINSPKEWVGAVKMQLEGIVTDDPEGLLKMYDRVNLVSASV